MRPSRLMPSIGAVLGVLAFVATRAAAQGCAMCGSSVTPDDPLAGALNTSVLFLMATPYTLVGAVALWLFVQHRRRALPSPTDPKEE